ncbi:MAG TPA: hypothetical protein VLW85_05050 [Myxococcales bacterium]|nr:hypothetical protein [Myxococcales bacterium]
MGVKAEQLRPGDVLLIRSPGRLWWAVRLFDGAEVDRAALVLGDGRVAEISGSALVQRPLAEFLGSGEAVIARRLKETGSMEPVLARAADLGEQRAAGQPEVLLALLCCSRKLRAAPSLRALQRSCLEAGAALTLAEPLTPGQFVWRCYEDALPEPSDVYTLHLNDLHNLEIVAGVPGEPGAGVSRRSGRGVHPDSLLAWAVQPLMRSRLAAAVAADAPPPLEELLMRYEQEMGDGIPAAMPGRAEADALLASLQRFAAAWSGGKASTYARGPLPAPLEMLFRATTDLCTAGELLRCEDLYTL